MDLFSSQVYSKIKFSFLKKFADKKKILNQSEFNIYIQNLEYSPIAYYWLDQVNNFLELQELSKECEVKDQEPLSETQDILFQVLSESEYAKDFLSFHKKTKSIKKATMGCEKIIKQQLSDIAKLYFLHKKASPNYRPIFELAEFSKKVVGPREPEHHFKIDSLSIKFFSFDKKNLKEHIVRIENAINKIKRFSPDSFERLAAFTNTIIPLKQKELVSYSEQNLPGISIINLYERDDLDLIDDLLHENGHHHLNMYLNQQDLLFEEEDKIYYSPWRESLRPIRGIYHAVFTFFWALKIYADLLIHKENFNKKEQKKIVDRFLEEFLMIQYCKPDLEYAFENGLITNKGMELMSEIYKQVDSYEDLFYQNKTSKSDKLVDKLVKIRNKHSL